MASTIAQLMCWQLPRIQSVLTFQRFTWWVHLLSHQYRATIKDMYQWLVISWRRIWRCGCCVSVHQGSTNSMRYREMSQVFPQAFNIIHFDSLIGRKKLEYKNKPHLWSAECTTDCKRKFYMDFGFMRASTSNYLQPNKKHDRVALSHDGYSTYLLIVYEGSRYACHKPWPYGGKHSSLKAAIR